LYNLYFLLEGIIFLCILNCKQYIILYNIYYPIFTYSEYDGDSNVYFTLLQSSVVNTPCSMTVLYIIIIIIIMTADKWKHSFRKTRTYKLSGASVSPQGVQKNWYYYTYIHECNTYIGTGYLDCVFDSNEYNIL